MMNPVLSLHEITPEDRPRVGGKAFALALMQRAGMHVPDALCISTQAYQDYVSLTGLRDLMHMELYRKPFDQMRWEEIWDTSLRIRNMFAKTPLPSALRDQIHGSIARKFSGRPVSVRSSAPGEDSAKTSFAGLHDSFVNVRDVESIIEHIRLVWASLWSDRALLYRQELDLDVEKSTMAIVIQEMVFGERSGIVFGMSPINDTQAALEAVYGLNQGLVDGTVEPDRWILDRRNGNILDHHPAQRQKILAPGPHGVRMETLPPELSSRKPLRNREVKEVYRLAMAAEDLFGTPQDAEWTYCKEVLHALQARPITSRTQSTEDQRPWYLSLHRSFENLKGLRQRIEKEILPQMEKEAFEMGRLELSKLSDSELAMEIRRRRERQREWMETYRRDCIPFAHGIRLFGEVYNDLMKPQDPFQFTALLAGSGMISIQRNQMLQELAALIHKHPGNRSCILEDQGDDDNMYLGKINGQVLAAVEEGRRRIRRKPEPHRHASQSDDLFREVQIVEHSERNERAPHSSGGKRDFFLRARQILGQPACQGLAVGKARTVIDSEDLFKFQKGEILVCDAVDPAMTFVIPLAAGIVERRGGMLIHGSIIAREYGIPCVTGVPDAVNQIQTGDFITVDGHLGIVIIG